MRFEHISLFGFALVLGCIAVQASAAPVLWAPRPGGIVVNGQISQTDDAEALDQLTAPLSAEQMGWTTGLDFQTAFDEDIRQLRAEPKVEDPQENIDAAPDVQDMMPNPLRRPGAPTLRYVPTLRSAPDF